MLLLKLKSVYSELLNSVIIEAELSTVFTLLLWDKNVSKFEDINCMSFPQLKCLVGTSRSNFVNFVKMEL